MPELTNTGQSRRREEDTPHVSGDPGILALVVRHDAGGTLVDADGDNAPLQTNAAGALRVTAVGAAGGTSMADDTAFTVEVDTFTPVGGILDDVAPDSVNEGDGGVYRMSANRNQYVQLRDAAGNERGLNVDAAGALAAQANIRDGAGVALTSTPVAADQALDVNIVQTVGGAGGTSMADDAPFTPGTTQITPAGAMLDDVAPDTVNEGDAGIVRMSANRNMYVTLRDAAGNERGLNVDAAGLVGVTDGGLSLGVDDNGGSLTIDDGGLTLSVDDGGGALTVDGVVTANIRDGAGAALTSTLVGADQALDVNLVQAVNLTIQEPLSVDDNGASLTVDNPALSVVGGGAEATAQRVTIANDSTGVVTVDNTVLSVVGGGIEATAQRVTIANDSTGVLSVDDNGASLTVDAAGDVADDAADSGNPVKIGGVAVETDGTDPTSVTAENDRAEVRTDRNRRLLINTVHPNLWSTNNNWAAAQTDTEVKAVPGAGLSLYITDVTMSTDGACNIKLVRNTAASVDIFGPFYFAANGGLVKHFATPIRLPANENLGVTSSAAVNHTVSVQGYIAP